MFDKNLLKLPGMKGVFMALFIFSVLQAGLIVGWACGLSDAVSVLWSGSALDAALPGIGQFAACFALLQLVRFAQETMLDRYSLDRANDLRERLLTRTFDERTMLSHHVGTARVAAIATDGIDEVQTYIRIISPKLIGLISLSIPLLIAEYCIDVPSGVILTVMFPVIIFFMVLIGRQARDHAEKQYGVYTRMTNHFMDTLRGLPVIQSFGAVKKETEAIYENSESVRISTIRTLRMATLSSAILDFCATFGVAAVAIMLAFRLMDGSLTLFTGLAALIIAPEYFVPIRSFAGDYHASLDGKNSLAAVLDLCDGKSSPSSIEVPLVNENVETITFENVCYHYPGTDAGVDDMTFSLSFGQKVGVVGPSGSGKSTLANLLAGFTTPTQGTISVNDKTVDLVGRAWKNQVRYIPQHPFVFHATLLDNIRFYHPLATREEALAAAEAVGLGELIENLDDGIDTLIGQGARGLSGGEAHRVALARVLLDDQARILVFDEPTAHLDIQTERDLKPAMLNVMEGRLVLIATHRLHWMQDMDRVITLEDGRIARITTRGETA